VKISELKHLVPIATVAADLGIVVNASHMALCPVHGDQRPSMSIGARGGNYFRCFSCGAHGSIVDLVAAVQGCNIREACLWIESRYGPSSSGTSPREPHRTQHRPSPQEHKPPDRRDGREYSDIYADLVGRCDRGEAVEYLKGRGITSEVTEAFSIACLPLNPKTVIEAMVERFGLERLKASGILYLSRNGLPSCSLGNNRLIIPYYDGEVIVNLQGRDIDGCANVPKYKHLPGIAVRLYNMKDLPAGSRVLLCEGAMDVLSCMTLGLLHPVGVAGTSSFKPEYYELFIPYNVGVCADNDTAGAGFYMALRKGFLERGQKVSRLDYDALKAQYHITGEVKDINDVCRLARGKRVHSELLGEVYLEEKDGIRFETGVHYDHDELKKLEGCSDAVVKAVHAIKKGFQGKVTL